MICLWCGKQVKTIDVLYCTREHQKLDAMLQLLQQISEKLFPSMRDIAAGEAKCIDTCVRSDKHLPVTECLCCTCGVGNKRDITHASNCAFWIIS